MQKLKFCNCLNNNHIFDLIANSLNRFYNYNAIVEGHSNPTTAPGTAARTREQGRLLTLSENRARVVVEELVRRGIDHERLSALGAGVERPIYAWNDRENNWKNRRVELILIRMDEPEFETEEIEIEEIEEEIIEEEEDEE